MKRVVLVFLVIFGVVFSLTPAKAQEATANANATANARAMATSGSAQVQVNNAPQVNSQIGIGVEVNPGQTVAPTSESAVVIDSHAQYTTRYTNRQFFPISVGGSPIVGGPIQPFVRPKAFGYPWNFSPVLEGKWEKKEDVVKKIKIKELKEYCYLKLSPTKKVIVVTDHKVLIEGRIIGEVKIKAAETEDSRAVQMAAIDKLASWGANIIWIRVNALEHEAKSSYSGFILGGGAGGIMAEKERAAVSGSGGIGKGSSRLSFLHYPIVEAIGYHGKIIEVKKEKKVEKEEKNENGDGKKWQAIQP